MKVLFRSTLAAATAVLPAAPVVADDAAVELRQDAEYVIGGIGVACTGIGGSKEYPKWKAFPLRIEFANDLREHLIGAELRVSDVAGEQLVNVSCWGAWLLLKPPGQESYKVEATMIGRGVPSRSATVRAPASGQTRIVLEFPGVDE